MMKKRNWLLIALAIVFMSAAFYAGNEYVYQIKAWGGLSVGLDTIGGTGVTKIDSITLVGIHLGIWSEASDLNEYSDFTSSGQTQMDLKAAIANTALTGNTTVTNIAIGGGIKIDSIIQLISGEIAIMVGADTVSIYTPYADRSTDEPLLKDIAVNAQTGTTYTLALTDRGKHVTLTNAGAITLTVPPNSSVAFPYDASGDGQTQIVLSQLGAGTVTFTEGSGVTINSSGGADALTAQYTSATLIKTGINTWLLSGSIE